MKILLLGANGQLGQTFLMPGGLVTRGELVAASRDGTLIQPDLRGVTGDLSDPDGICRLLEYENPDIIVNAAAYTAVDKAEADEATATRINGEAPGILGQWAAKSGALVVHFSTDYVFRGDATTPYLPSAATEPQGAYGRSKLAGELALRCSGAAHMIFRTAWVYSPFGHNFLRTMLRLGRERDELRVVADQHGTPTSTRIIVDGTLAAIDQYVGRAEAKDKLSGTYHLTAAGETTWHGFAEAIFTEAGACGMLSRSPRVEAIETSAFPTPAKRPAYSVLDNTSFIDTFGMTLPDWRDGLRETVRSIPRS